MLHWLSCFADFSLGILWKKSVRNFASIGLFKYIYIYIGRLSGMNIEEPFKLEETLV